MRKNLLFLLLAVVACFVGAKADELTVADGTSNNAFVPLYGAYADFYQKCEYIIPETDLEDMVGGTITDLTWYLSQQATTSWGNASFLVFMKTVEGTTLSAYTGYDDATVVYTGSLDGTQETMSIELSETFNYTGGNLLIGVYQTTKGTYKSATFYGKAATGASVSGYNSTSMANISINQRNFIPKTTFIYESEQVDYKVRVTPESLAFGNLYVDTEKEITVTLKNVGQLPITPALSAVNAPFSFNYTSTELAYGESVQIPVKFAPTAAGEYSGQLVINCGGAGEVNLNMSGSAALARNVCDGTNTDNYLPFFGKWTDTQGTLGQMLYPASEFKGLEGVTITGIVFYPTEPMLLDNPTVELSLKATDETYYTRESNSSAPDNLVTDLTTVASTTITNSSTELVFNFTTPFVYEGGNLAVQTLVTAEGGWKDTYFYGVNQTTYTGYSQYSTSKTLCMFLPKMTLFYTLPVNEQVINYTAEQENGTIEVTLANGTPVVSQETKVAAGEPVTVKATANDGYVITAFEVTAGGEPLELDIENGANGAPLRATGPKQETHTFVMPNKEVNINVAFEVKTAINDIDANVIDGKVNVYNMQGQMIKRDVEAGAAAQGLPAGIYLIGNKKVVVK